MGKIKEYIKPMLKKNLELCPLYAKILNTTMRRLYEEVDNRNNVYVYYYRDNGDWECNVRFNKGKIMTDFKSTYPFYEKDIKDVEVIAITKEEWEKENVNFWKP